MCSQTVWSTRLGHINGREIRNAALHLHGDPQCFDAVILSVESVIPNPEGTLNRLGALGIYGMLSLTDGVFSGDFWGLFDRVCDLFLEWFQSKRERNQKEA